MVLLGTSVLMLAGSAAFSVVVTKLFNKIDD
ncbi:hypothetical protein IAD21_00627 [Abditibacteriota bacterium]|nr:hypothetical protein IAD21_00627 [Abditibacteriota bacterium]